MVVHGVGAETPYGVPTFDGLEVKQGRHRLPSQKSNYLGAKDAVTFDHWLTRRFVATQAIDDDEYVETLAPVQTSLRREQMYRRSLALADGLAAIAGALIAASIWGITLTPLLLLVPLIAVIVGKVQGLYDRDDMVVGKSTVGEWRAVLRAALLTTLGTYVVWWLFIHPTPHHSLRLFALVLALIFGVDLPARALARRITRVLTTSERCLIVGSTDGCAGLADSLRRLPGVELVATVSDDDVDCTVAGICELVGRLNVERIIAVPHSGWGEPGVLKLVQSAKWLGVRVSLMPTVMAVVGAAAAIDTIDSKILLGVPRFGLSRSSQAVKRALDLGAATLLLAISAPAFLVIAIAIRTDSAGRAFFRQRRIGRNGKPFTMYKFRSMIEGAEAMQADLDAVNESRGLFKMVDDPRVTKIGHLLRRTYLDELPQLLNVLRGDMSLVGPRPLVEHEDSLLTGYDRHRSRLTPGMTGPWQLRGPLEASLPDLAKLDYIYASNWSIWADIDILLATSARIFSRRGH